MHNLQFQVSTKIFPINKHPLHFGLIKVKSRRLIEIKFPSPGRKQKISSIVSPYL